MTPAALLVLPVVSGACALVVAGLSPAHTLVPRLALALQAPLVIYVLYLLGVALPSSDGGLVDTSGVWVSVGDLFVETSFHFGGATAVACGIVSVVTSLCLWRSMRVASAALSMLPAFLLGVQSSLWLCILSTDLPLSLAGFILAGFLLPRANSTSVDGTPLHRAVGIHRAADGFAMCSALVWLLWSPALAVSAMGDVQAAAEDGLFATVLGLSALPWLVLMLSAAICLRTLGVFLSQGHSAVTLAVGGTATLASAFSVFRYMPARLWWAPLLALVLGVATVYLVRAVAASARLSASLGKPLHTFGWTVATIQRFVFDGFVLQTPIFAADAVARLLKLLAGGDIQRYVAIGLIGLAGLVFVATSPAAPAALTIHTDGLRVQAVALRGELSARRLQYDYDFDGDAQIDRVAGGPSASFTYAAAGTYSVSVTIRDPFWHTKKTLQAKVKVHP